MPETIKGFHLPSTCSSIALPIGWWVFAIAGIAALLLALFTISFQAIKAATANPVKNLRTE